MALGKAKKLPRGSKLTSRPMSELLAVSWPTLRDWCDDIAGFEESGAFVRGGNGVEWEFKPVATLRFLVRRFEAQLKSRAARAKTIRRAVAGDVLDGLPADFDLDEITKMIRAASLVREERERQGELVNRARVETAIREMVSRMQQAGVKAAHEQDPTGQWPPDVREKFEDAFNNLLVTMARAGEECLRTLRAGTPQSAQLVPAGRSAR